MTLAISIIRPVIVRPRIPAERGAIVLLIDRSPSMGVVDNGRTPSQLVALAQGIQMLPRGIRPKSALQLEEAPDTLRAIVADLYLARGQLDYARIAGQSIDIAQKRLGDMSGARKSWETIWRIFRRSMSWRISFQISPTRSTRPLMSGPAIWEI